MRVLPIRVNFEVNEITYQFRIELVQKSLVVYQGESIADLDVGYNPRVPVFSHDNSNALYNAFQHLIDLFSRSHLQTLTETNKNMIVSYLHRRVTKVSNNYFNVPLCENNFFNTRVIEAATVTH